MAEVTSLADILKNLQGRVNPPAANPPAADNRAISGDVAVNKAPARAPQVRGTETQRNFIRAFESEQPAFKGQFGGFTPENKTLPAVGDMPLKQYLLNNPVTQGQASAAFVPQIEGPERFAARENSAQLRGLPFGDPRAMGVASQNPFSGPGTPQSRLGTLQSLIDASRNPASSALPPQGPSNAENVLERMAGASRNPAARALPSQGPQQYSMGTEPLGPSAPQQTMGDRMASGSAGPRSFWDNAGNSRTMSGASVLDEAGNLRKAAGAAGAVGAALTGGLGTLINRSPAAIPPVLAGGVAQEMANPESRYSQALRGVRESVKDAYRTEGLPAAIARQIGAIPGTAYETLGAAGQPLEQMAQSGLRNLAIGAGLAESPSQAMARARDIYDREIAPNRGATATPETPASPALTTTAPTAPAPTDQVNAPGGIPYNDADRRYQQYVRDRQRELTQSGANQNILPPFPGAPEEVIRAPASLGGTGTDPTSVNVIRPGRYVGYSAYDKGPRAGEKISDIYGGPMTRTPYPVNRPVNESPAEGVRVPVKSVSDVAAIRRMAGQKTQESRTEEFLKYPKAIQENRAQATAREAELKSQGMDASAIANDEALRRLASDREIMQKQLDALGAVLRYREVDEEANPYDPNTYLPRGR